MSIVIIGSGFAGLCMGIKLKQKGIHDFTILERGSDLGGTWRDNDYPGCACDVQSHLYSFSFEQNPDWSRMFAPQAEILGYLRRCAEKHGLWPHIRLNENVEEARFDESTKTWTVRTSAGKEYRASVVVSGMGALSNPAYPKIPGMDRFEGKAFHSAKWDHAESLAGKRVAVIGTGASAIQFVPRVAKEAAQVDLYQRTAPWILPKPDRPISAIERLLFRILPFTQKLFRSAIYWMLELRVLGMVIHPKLMKLVEKAALAYLKKQVPDPELRKKLTPDYTIGCKRILLSDEWYPALTRDNVDVITSGIREITARGVVTDDGVERPVDVLIYGTGFHVDTVVPERLIFGRGGQDLREAWKGGVEAYKGASIVGFPNFFMILGPNTGLGHSSMIFIIESQVAYVMDALAKMQSHGWATVEVERAAQTRYNDAIQARHRGAVWQSGCKSWYLDANGRNTTVWPGFTFTFRRQTAEFDAACYRVTEASAAPQKAPVGVTARLAPPRSVPVQEAL